MRQFLPREIRHETDTMNLLIVYPEFYGVGGIARYLDNFLHNIPTDAQKVFLLTGDEGFKKKSITNVEIIHIPYIRGRFGLIKWGFHARRMIKKLIVSGKIDHINLHLPPLIPGLFFYRVSLCSDHSYDLHRYDWKILQGTILQVTLFIF